MIEISIIRVCTKKKVKDSFLKIPREHAIYKYDKRVRDIRNKIDEIYNNRNMRCYQDTVILIQDRLISSLTNKIIRKINIVEEEMK